MTKKRGLDTEKLVLPPLGLNIKRVCGKMR